MDPIIVAGAGPVGLAVANGLVERGLPVVVLDPRPGIPEDPRATTLQPRVLEVFEQWDLLGDLLPRGRKVRSLSYWDARSRKPILELDYGLLDDTTTCPYRLHIAQWEVCEVLHDRLPPGTVHWGRRVSGVEDDGEGVTVHLSDHTRLSGSFLVGADGLGSSVRRLAGIDLETGIKDVFFTCETGERFSEFLPEGVGDCAYFLDGADWGLAMRLPRRWRFLFRVPTGMAALEAMADEQLGRWTGRILGAGSPLPVEQMRNRATYAVQMRLARTFRRGRVLLAGDAAHALFPVGGTAMNTGILDAEALANALAEGTEGILDAYGVERREELRSGVFADAQAAWRTLTARGFLQQWQRGRTLEGLLDGAAAKQHLLRSSML